ncbi:MAG: NAD-dependent epimerase/dehydratase family protein [Candidatus Caldarchaeum sp.]|nr:NAD-dependent epimerase/dehydratase family protein [Candidatus Caldarchaeum sp.]MDW7977528.1 NAD-dependent epimerase/dehydratase family protein [Candidatus Caldarchaeum sp.]
MLITGASGFVGRHLAEYLRRRGFEVAGADIAPGADVQVDVTDFNAVLRVFEQASPSYVVHLAAVADIAEALKNPHRCFSVNVAGSLNVLEAARLRGLERVVVFSSANYYGAPEKVPVSETTPPSPRTVYDYSKVALENVVWSYRKNHGLPVVVLRPWKAFGEYEPVVKMVPRFITACLENKPIPLYNGGADVTDPYHVENLCYAVELCLTCEKAVGEAFNVGTGGSVSVKQLAEKIRQMTGSSSELQMLPPRTPAESTPMVSVPSIEKIRKTTGYMPVVSLEEGLRRVIDYLSRKMKG